jgi:integrin beta 3
MLDIANAEMLGNYVVREIKDILAERMKATKDEINQLHARINDLQFDLQILMERSVKQGEPGPPGPQGSPGKDGRDGSDGIGLASAFIDRGDNLVVTMTDGTVGSLGNVRGPAGLDGKNGIDGKDGRDGRDGADGLAIDDMVEELSDDGMLVHKYIRGGVVKKEWKHRLKYMRWAGIYKADADYDLQNVVTWDGSCWLAKGPTREKPGNGSRDWTLITKRGRDGKDGESIIGPVGPPGRDGRDLTQLMPDGTKY